MRAGGRRGAKAALTALVAAVAGLALWSVGVEPGRLVVRRHTVAVTGWPAALAGWTIVALTDIHAGALGLIREQDHALFVSPGVGTSIVPVRFRVTPEVSVLTLVPASGAS